MKKLRNLVLISTALSGLSACSTPDPKPDYKQPDSVIVSASNDLISVAKEIRESNKQLNILIQQKVLAKNAQKAPSIAQRDIPNSLKKNVTLRWNGKAEPAIKMIAQAIGYSYKKPEGTPPMIPLVVSVNALETNAYSVLRDIGLQLGQEAILLINPAKKELGVSYIKLTKKEG